MKNVVSEFINKRILDVQRGSAIEKSTSWTPFLYKKLLSHSSLLKEFLKSYNPTQNQVDFSRSVSLYNIFKVLKNKEKYFKDMPKEYLLVINKNIKKFPPIETTLYYPPDNIRFEPVLNLDLLKLVFESLEKTKSTLNETGGKKQITLDLKWVVESEIKSVSSRIAKIEADVRETPKILTEIKRSFKKANLNKNPKISIVTASYNLAPLVEGTMRSVDNQKSDDFEHIVIDGGSTDGSIRIIKKYPDTIIVSEKDFGYTDAFWKGLRLARGKYITQCAISDGYATTEWIKKCAETLDKNKEVSLVWGFPRYLTENSKLGLISYPQFHYKDAPQKQEMFNYWLKSGFFYPEGNLFVRKSVMLKCYPTVNECKKGIIDWLEFSYRFNSLGYISMHLPIVANFGRTHGRQLGERMEKRGEMKKGRENYLKKITNYKIKLLLGLTRHNFIDPDGNKINLKFDKEKFVTKDIIRNFLTVDEQYLKPKKYLDFIKRKILI